MEILNENVFAKGPSPGTRFKALLVNFGRLLKRDPPLSTMPATEYSYEDLLHAVAGLCSVALPDMEESAIYCSLTRSSSKTIILLLSSVENQPSNHHRPRRKKAAAASGDSTAQSSGGIVREEDGEEPENPFLEVFSASDSSETESVEEEDKFSEGRKKFLEACRSRQQDNYDRPASSSHAPEEMVAGCGCFLRLSDSPQNNAVQILLVAVRHRWRRVGLGSYLIQAMKDPTVIGNYNALLTFADHKAEKFFAIHGFSDDPILTAKYRIIVDDWENSSLVVYIPPFSVQSMIDGKTQSSTATLSLCEDSYKTWRESAIAGYCEQLTLMQRLRHEVIFLHSQLETKEVEIEGLKQQLQKVTKEKEVLDSEFSEFRAKTEKLLLEDAANK